MARKKIIIGLLTIVFFQCLYGQKTSNIDFDEIKRKKSKKVQPNNESIYFDVSKPLESLQHLFKKNE